MAKTPWAAHSAGNWNPAVGDITAAGFTLAPGSTRYYVHSEFPGVAFFKGTAAESLRSRGAVICRNYAAKGWALHMVAGDYYGEVLTNVRAFGDIAHIRYKLAVSGEKQFSSSYPLTFNTPNVGQEYVVNAIPRMNIEQIFVADAPTVVSPTYYLCAIVPAGNATGWYVPHICFHAGMRTGVESGWNAGGTDWYYDKTADAAIFEPTLAEARTVTGFSTLIQWNSTAAASVPFEDSPGPEGRNGLWPNGSRVQSAFILHRTMHFGETCLQRLTRLAPQIAASVLVDAEQEAIDLWLEKLVDATANVEVALGAEPAYMNIGISRVDGKWRKFGQNHANWKMAKFYGTTSGVSFNTGVIKATSGSTPPEYFPMPDRKPVEAALFPLGGIPAFGPSKLTVEGAAAPYATCFGMDLGQWLGPVIAHHAAVFDSAAGSADPTAAPVDVASGETDSGIIKKLRCVDTSKPEDKSDFGTYPVYLRKLISAADEAVASM